MTLCVATSSHILDQRRLCRSFSDFLILFASSLNGFVRIVHCHIVGIRIWVYGFRKRSELRSSSVGRYWFQFLDFETIVSRVKRPLLSDIHVKEQVCMSVL